MRGKENLLGNSLLFVLFVLVLLPMLTVLFQIVCPGLQWEAFNLGNLVQVFDVFEKPLWKTALMNTVSLSTATTILGLIVATALAFIRVRYAFVGAKLIDITAWILMIIPSFILAQGWIFFSSGNGIAKEWLGLSGLNEFLFSFSGLVFIMVLCKFPLAYIAIKNVLEWYPESLIQAAKMNGASPMIIWRKIQGPLCLPAFLSSAMLIFMDTVGDYGMSSTITAAFPFPTLPYTIYGAITTVPTRFDMAGILSLYLIALIILAMVIQRVAVGRKKFDFLSNDAVPMVPQKVGKMKSFGLSLATFLFCGVALGIPIGSNVIISFSDGFSVKQFNFTLQNYTDVLTSSGTLISGMKNSFWIASFSAIIGVLVGFCIAFLLTYSEYKGKKLIDSITLIAMAVPGVILGIGYIFVWNQSWLEKFGLHLYGKPQILILASVAAVIPLTNRILVAGMAKIPEDLMIAGSMQGAGLLLRIRKILLPLLHTTSVSAILAAFGGSVFNLAITTILYPANFHTLPVYISNAYNALNFGYSAAATIIGGGLVVVIMLTLEFILNFKKIKTDSRGKS